MKFNEKDLILVSQGFAQYEGTLGHRAPPSFRRDSGYRERYFKLIGNLLFYFRFTEWGAADTKEPAGVLVLENYSVQPEYEDTEASFSFSILFLDEPDKKHIFCARTDTDVQKWVNALQKASYQHWRDKLDSMQNNLTALREARQSPAFLFQNGRSRSPRLNPFASPQIQRRLQHCNSVPSLQRLPPPPLPPRRRYPSPNPLRRSNECEDLIHL